MNEEQGGASTAGRRERRDLRETQEFFAARAAGWDEKFPDDDPAFAAAVAELALEPGATVLDAGCGTARAFAPLRAAVGGAGHVVGVDVTPSMIWSARDRGRGAWGHLLVGDAARLPLRDGVVHGVLAAGLVGHLPDAAAVLAELARVTVAGGRLALFHPVGRAALAARHGRVPDAGDVRAEPNLRPLLAGTGWTLTACDDGDDRYLALAVRTGRDPSAA
ncbi:class I SAM-dependent methyltransferase [Sphaerisporangium sp. TRM90804]|uniref:class I SAM-dependent methyltransferase n=1 Tax=Sphaerisporangium sp. TRM90804 TaxID=3031113 RepID=UPI002449743A|nr:class I SAM-dependent methyltransferase [Sphaerisporangium sp. TRM90804]MDH2425381.1 class I SAM-dependent methyltransferase [Sphaerisporangium sp. TRM90804]